MTVAGGIAVQIEAKGGQDKEWKDFSYVLQNLSSPKIPGS